MNYKTPKTIPADRLYAVAEEQGGYFTAADALGAGYSYPLQHFHARRGNWLRVDRGVFRLRRFPSTPHEDLLRWWLWSRKEGVISFESAAAAYDLGDLLPAQVHLTVPPSFRKKPPAGLVLHRAILASSDIRAWEGLRLTSPLRTLTDLAESPLDPERLEGVARDALRQGLVSRREIRTILEKNEKISKASREVLVRVAEE